jgi:hypothetical protein
LNKKKEEKHISVSEDLHNRLKIIAKKSGRTMRGMLAWIIDKEEKAIE